MKKPDVFSSIDLNVEGPINENTILFYHCESEQSSTFLSPSKSQIYNFFAEIIFAVTR